MSNPGDLEEPLIAPFTADGRNKLRRVETFSENGGDLDVYRRSLLSVVEVDEATGLPTPRPGADTFIVTTISLSKVILGSGMLVCRQPLVIFPSPARTL